MTSEEDKYLIVSYCTCTFAVVAFAVYAVFTYLKSSREKVGDKFAEFEDFITARHSQSTSRIAWSFFASKCLKHLYFKLSRSFASAAVLASRRHAPAAAWT